MRRNPSLDDIENAAAEADTAAARYSALRRRDNREPSTLRGALGGPGRCWCEGPLGHDWPGKASGAPHPRVQPEGLRPAPASAPQDNSGSPVLISAAGGA